MRPLRSIKSTSQKKRPRCTADVEPNWRYPPCSMPYHENEATRQAGAEAVRPSRPPHRRTAAPQFRKPRRAAVAARKRGVRQRSNMPATGQNSAGRVPPSGTSAANDLQWRRLRLVTAAWRSRRRCYQGSQVRAAWVRLAGRAARETCRRWSSRGEQDVDGSNRHSVPGCGREAWVHRN